MTDLIERELALPASLRDVWRAITDPKWLAGWLADEVELELRPGGEASFKLGDELRTGWVEEVSAPGELAPGPSELATGPGEDVHDPGDGRDSGTGRLAFWWARDDEPASRVELVITEISDEQTHLRVVETRPLEILDLVGVPLGGYGPTRFGPALVAA
jgi:uncharacterized protein YndB with AHSA1/START domain